MIGMQTKSFQDIIGEKLIIQSYLEETGSTPMLYYNNICDWLWEKGHIRANNDFSV